MTRDDSWHQDEDFKSFAIIQVGIAGLKARNFNYPERCDDGGPRMTFNAS
jgi:hypothetical protein